MSNVDVEKGVLSSRVSHVPSALARVSFLASPIAEVRRKIITLEQQDISRPHTSAPLISLSYVNKLIEPAETISVLSIHPLNEHNTSGPSPLDNTKMDIIQGAQFFLRQEES